MDENPYKPPAADRSSPIAAGNLQFLLKALFYGLFVAFIVGTVAMAIGAFLLEVEAIRRGVPPTQL